MANQQGEDIFQKYFAFVYGIQNKTGHLWSLTGEYCTYEYIMSVSVCLAIFFMRFCAN